MIDVTLDLETIPTQKAEVLEAIQAAADLEAEDKILELKPPANIKDPAKIEAWVQNDLPAKTEAIRMKARKDADQDYRKTALDGTLGEIAVIGWAIGDDEPQALYRNPHESEAELLAKFYQELQRQVRDASSFRNTEYEKIRWVGHNVLGFDLRFMFQRSVINEVKPTFLLPVNATPWATEQVFDTMLMWAGSKGRVAMDKLCSALGVMGKGEELGGEEIDGSMVWDFIQAGRIEDVATYCKGDVIRARRIKAIIETYLM